jgi:hypothetical protein
VEEGRCYLVYLFTGGAVNVSVTAGSYYMTWINAQNTSDRRYAGMTNDGKKLSAPNDGDDWLLLLTAQNTDSAGLLNPE